jgi:hypothetical protein
MELNMQDIDKNHVYFCDICANKYPCHVCGSRGKEGYAQSSNTLFNAIYGKSVIKKVLLRPNGEIVVSDITKADVKDLGWSMYVSLDRIPDYDKVIFGIPDMPVNSLFKDVKLIERAKTTASDAGISQVYVGWLND